MDGKRQWHRHEPLLYFKGRYRLLETNELAS